MKLELTIDGVEKNYNIPESWDDVTLGMFEKIVSIDMNGENDLLDSMKLVSAVTGMEMEDVMLIPIDEMPKILDLLKFANTEVEQRKTDSIKIGDDEYFVKDDFNKMTTGEVISVDMISKKYNGKVERAISEFMCIFLRKKVDGKLETFKAEFMERADLFRESVKVTDVYQLFVFFSNGETTLSGTIKESLEEEAKEKATDSH